MIVDGSKIYEKAIKEVSNDQAIDADLYEQINITTAHILGIEKVLQEIESEVKGAHKHFKANKNISSLKAFSSFYQLNFNKRHLRSSSKKNT